jgi:hypothetical protein
MKNRLLFILVSFAVLNLFAFNNSYSGPRNLVIEFSTGTWCGFCPCGEHVADSLLTVFPNMIVIGYHSGGNDPFAAFQGNAIFGMIGYTASPTACIDRTNHPGNAEHPYMSYSMWAEAVTQRYNTSPSTVVDISISSKSYNSTTRELSANIDATALQNLTGQYKIHFILVENGVVYPQNHYEPCGPYGYDSDYVHKWIPRSIINGAAGENLNAGGVWNQNQTLTKSFTYTLNNAWVASNCNFITIVYRDSSEGLFVSAVQQALLQSVTNPLGVSTLNRTPLEYSLSQNYPNPFNPATNIKFSIPKDGNASLKVYDLLGNEISSYINGFMKAGAYNAEIDASNWASGVYFYTLTAPGFTATRKMMLVK